MSRTTTWLMASAAVFFVAAGAVYFRMASKRKRTLPRDRYISAWDRSRTGIWLTAADIIFGLARTSR